MPFSHATEHVLSGLGSLFSCGNKSVDDIVNVTNRRLNKSLRFSEVLSLLVILSTRFSRFYTSYVRYGAAETDSLLRISCLVAGLAPEPRLSGIAELISASVVDADKIDYVNRDAYSCGIPVGVDVSRIFLRSGFLRASRERLLKSGLKESPPEEEILFVVNASGLDTVDEITQARAALYQRVYLHAVTRAAESVYAGALEINARDTNGEKELADAISLWAKNDDVLLPNLARSVNSEVKLHARRLLDRQLPKKACVFSSSIANMQMPLQQLFPLLPQQEAAALRKQVINTPLENLTAKKVMSGLGHELIGEIKAELDTLIAKIASEKRQELIPQNRPIELIELIGSAYMDHVQMDCIVLQNGELLRTSRFTNIREQTDAFDIFKAVGFVMCDPLWRHLVFLAARTVLCRPSEEPQPTAVFETRLAADESDSQPAEQVMFVPRMILDLDGIIRRSGIQRTKANATIEAATEGGYFDDKPILARPIDNERADVRAVADKLGKFDGQRSWRVSRETVGAFLNQFPPSLRDTMLRALADKMIFFDRAEICSSLLAKIREIKPSDVAALSPNSGNFARVLVQGEAKGDAALAEVRFHSEIAAALSSDTDGPLVLIDDNISSATQSRAQFLSWCGRPRDEWPIECQDEEGIFRTPLSSEMLQRMQSRSIYIVTCAGRDTASDVLGEMLAGLGFKKFEGLRFRHSIAHASDWPSNLRSYLEGVGRQLIAWSKFRQPLSELTLDQMAYCEERAFGYGNVGGLVATGLNVPTATATAIWCPGMYDGSPWMPLLIRHNKLRHLVIA